jgi:hypothetical protein
VLLHRAFRSREGTRLLGTFECGLIAESLQHPGRPLFVQVHLTRSSHMASPQPVAHGANKGETGCSHVAFCQGAGFTFFRPGEDRWEGCDFTLVRSE